MPAEAQAPAPVQIPGTRPGAGGREPPGPQAPAQDTLRDRDQVRRGLGYAGEGYMTASTYPDDGVGEVFLKLGKQGSTLVGM